MKVFAKPARSIDSDAFSDITEVPVTGTSWLNDGLLEVEFATDLTQPQQDAVRRRMESRNANEETIRHRAEQALAANRNYLGLNPPTQAQIVQQVERLTRQNVGIIRQILGLLDGTD